VNDDAPSFDEKHAPDIELKPLPSLRYKLLGLNSTYPMIVNTILNASQVDSLLRILRMHHKAKGYTLDDPKRLHPSVCMHHILMEDDQKRQLNTKEG